VAKKTHTLTVLVENKAGVLNRVTSLFRRRRFNIESLTVGHSEQPGLSRITLVVDGTNTNVEQVIRQMYRIIEVIKVEELSAENMIVRDLALVQVTAPTKAKTAKLQTILRGAAAKVLQKKTTGWVIQLTAEPKAIDQLVRVLQPFGLLAVARTGATAIATYKSHVYVSKK
jgi:acetolactate synthase-1/3 small subunit